MKLIIKERFKHGLGLYPTQMLIGIIYKRSKSAANYPPAVAKIIFNKHLPNEGNSLDPCGGFGGRLLGAITSGKMSTHIILEPNEQTINYSKLMYNDIKEHLDCSSKFTFIRTPAESWEPESKRNFFDLVFTCPPYFDQEIYSNEPDQVCQSCKSYEDYNSWVNLVISKWVRMLKIKGWLIIHVSDPYVSGKKRLPIVKTWKDAMLNNPALREYTSWKYVRPKGEGKRAEEVILRFRKIEVK